MWRLGQVLAGNGRQSTTLVRRSVPLSVLLAAFTLALTVLTSAARSAPKDAPPALGVQLRDVWLFDLAGQRHDLAEVEAKCVVIIFWAFWCDTWKKTLPALTDLASEKAALSCELWAVSVDSRWTEQIRPLVIAGHIPFPVLLDDGTLSRRLGVRRIPTVLVLNQSRRVVWAHEGYPGNEVLERAIRRTQ